MSNTNIILERIVIDKSVAESPLARNVLQGVGNTIPVQYIADSVRYVEGFNSRNFLQDSIGAGKRILLITPNKGSFFKNCPGTPRYLCCLYKILNFATGCPLECSYCILQGYFSSPLLTLYANTDKMLSELERIFNQWSGRVLRLGTGEFTDSLALDELTGFNSFIIPFIRRWGHVFFEVKTKTATIASLEEFKNDRHIICSWSLSPQRIINNEEQNTASLVERLKAAQRCQDWGFGLGFHFDPIIYYEGWEDEYYELIRSLFSSIDWRRIYWISLGTLRFPAYLKEIIERRFPETKITFAEFITGGDGKLRYFLPIRLRLYKQIYKWIRERAPEVVVYFCMENPLVWREVTGYSPESNKAVATLLDDSCLAHLR
ncbi:hypothetical protein J7M23_01880 [Candidatus Sumerlaeota bacterium]|nr:hypothetical protein [Candidatus Sumerlaeota bacterium]